MLTVVGVSYNPIGYVRQDVNLAAWRKALSVEDCNVFVWQDPVSGPKNIMWQKERMIAEVIQGLPAEYDKVAWVDADMLFCNPFWYEQADELLDKFPVCHLFDAVCNTDVNGRVYERKEGVGWRWQNKRNDTATWYRPGGAWAARREIAESCFYHWDILGGGDSATTFAWTGEFERYNRHRSYSPEWSKHYLAWAKQQHEMVQGQIGCVSGDVVHLWHGDIDNRQYGTRPKILADHRFNPFEDIRIGEEGLWEWATEKPELHNAVRKYFIRRDEGERRCRQQAGKQSA